MAEIKPEAELSALEQELERSLVEQGDEISKKAAKLKQKAEKDREFAKFYSAAWDRASTQIFAIGVFGPVAGLLFHTREVTAATFWQLVFACVCCLGAAVALNMVGSGILENGFSSSDS